MKTCPACGLHVEDDYIYCWEDGTRLSGVETRVLPQRSTAPMTPEEHATPFLFTSEAADEHRVLSCPVCSGEFPLTFSACPVHDLPLTSKRVSRVRALAGASPTIEEPVAQVLVSDEAPLPREPIETIELDFSHETQRQEESEANPITISRDSGRAGVLWAEVKDRARALRERITGSGYASIFGLAASYESQRRPAPPPGMRLAARATAIALSLFALGALYLFYRQVTRKPTRSAPAAAVKSGSGQVAQAESPVIATPPEARDYREEPAPAAQEPADPAQPNQAQKQTNPYRVSNDAVAPRIGASPPDRSTAPTQPATQPSGMAETVPSTTSGRFNAQLVRVRSYKAPSGYSYTLTFTLFEHTGRPIKWERLSIVTRSASGATHTDMVPFQHWLAGSGALTFTLNVDMAGPSEDDWRGRISCMSVGADETGRPLRASFGTNVAP